MIKCKLMSPVSYHTLWQPMQVMPQPVTNHLFINAGGLQPQCVSPGHSLCTRLICFQGSHCSVGSVSCCRQCLRIQLDIPLHCNAADPVGIVLETTGHPADRIKSMWTML